MLQTVIPGRYLKNCYVALCSARIVNPNDDVCLFTNIGLEEEGHKRFESKGITIQYCAYDSFQFDKDFGWSLAYYKLCALKEALEALYENYLLIDTDTYT